MRIAISGKSGCGNTTVSRLVSEKLGCRMINFTFRQMAEERGVDFWEFCRMAEDDYDIDRELDRRQVEMAHQEENCVLGSRLAIWMLEDADLKVYLKASAETRASRVLKREGGTFEERFEQTRGRDMHDTARYKTIYGIDNEKPEKVADIILDTDHHTPEELAKFICDEARRRTRQNN